MSYPVARVGSMVKVGAQMGKVITGASSHYVDGGGAVSGDGVSPEVAMAESIGMETEDMTDAEKRNYINNRFGGDSADSLNRASETNADDPGSENVANSTAKSSPVSCDGFTNSSADSTQISRYYTVADFSSAVYQAPLRHTIPNSTAAGLSRAETICNLKHLATNSIDYLRDWVPKNISGGYSFKIGSGFRNQSGSSDHNRGAAADLHFFKGGQRASREDLKMIAQKILNGANVPYTQFLLEYQGNDSLGWIHIANRKNGQNSSMRIGYSMDGRNFNSNLPRSV